MGRISIEGNTSLAAELNRRDFAYARQRCTDVGEVTFRPSPVMPAFVDKSRTLWLVVKTFDPIQHHRHVDGEDGYTSAGDGSLVQLKRGDYRTLEALEVEEERRRRELEERRRADRAALMARPAGAVTLSILEGRKYPTVREASAVIEYAGGELSTTAEGRLVVRLRAVIDDPTAQACRVLYAAEALVVEALGKGRELPDAEVLPTGATVPRAKR